MTPDPSMCGQYVRQVLATAPPLTPEQRDRLAALLHAGGERRRGHSDAA